jgi:hypothetical protein
MTVGFAIREKKTDSNFVDELCISHPTAYGGISGADCAESRFIIRGYGGVIEEIGEKIGQTG